MSETAHPTDTHDHAETEAHPPAHDHAAEVAHAWYDLFRDIKFFVGFFTLIIIAVIQFEIQGGPDNYWWVFGLGAARFALIGAFLYSLIRPFSLVVATLAFTVLFLGGMIFLSMWSSYLPTIGNPIVLPPQYSHSH